MDKFSGIKIKILHHKDKFFAKNYNIMIKSDGEDVEPICEAYLVQRVMAFLVINDKLDEYLKILLKFDIAPFKPIVLNKFNVLHLAVIFSSTRFVKNLTNVDFYMVRNKKKGREKIDWKEVTNI